MTVKNIINHIDKIKPNTFDFETKLLWLSEVDSRAQIEIHGKDLSDVAVPSGENYNLLIPDAYAEAYVYYILAMIDFLCGEFDRYSASSRAYNKVISDYAKYVIRGGK